MFEEINKSIERAKRRRLEALARFHIGDTVYPIYQTWDPTIWGVIIDINITTHKVTININGVERQYDPEELVLTNPETQVNYPNQKAIEMAEKLVAKDVSANLKFASNPLNELNPKLHLCKTSDTAYTRLLDLLENKLKGVKRDSAWENIRQVEKAIKDLGVDLEFGKVDSANYKVDGGHKDYHYTVSFVNIAEKKIVLDLILVASACGTVDDPWSAYDLNLMLRRGQVKTASIKTAAKELSKMIQDFVKFKVAVTKCVEKFPEPEEKTSAFYNAQKLLNNSFRKLMDAQDMLKFMRNKGVDSDMMEKFNRLTEDAIGEFGGAYIIGKKNFPEMKQEWEEAKKQSQSFGREYLSGNRNASIKTAEYDAKRFSDVQDDVYQLDLTISSIKLLYNYLYAHLSGKNVQQWKDREITNSRNEIRDSYNKANDREVKKVIDEVLKSFMKIKNEKKSLEDAIERLKDVFPKVKKLRDKYKDEEEALRKEWAAQKKSSKNVIALAQDSRSKLQIINRIEGFVKKAEKLTDEIVRYLQGQINAENVELDVSEDVQIVLKSLEMLDKKVEKLKKEIE